MPPLEIETYSQKTKRWSKEGVVKPDAVHTLFNFRPEDRKQEMIILQCSDDKSIIQTAELGEDSFVQSGRMPVIGGLGPLKEAARLGKGNSVEMTIRGGEYSIPIKYRFTHK